MAGATKERAERVYLGQGDEEVMDMPDLVDIQSSSFDRFLQKTILDQGQPVKRQGLEEVFQGTFPIESPNGDMVLEYAGYTLDVGTSKLSELECRKKGLTYSVPIKAKINLVFLNTGEIRQKEIYMGDIPLMTDHGTFIINGALRVVVSQIHRSPGVIFSHEKGLYSSRIIPYRGSWLEFEIDQKRELIYAKIDRKKKILATIFLRALGFASREEIIGLFYKTEAVRLTDKAEEKEKVVGRIFAAAVWAEEGGERKKLYRAGDKIHPHDIDELMHHGIKQVELIDLEHEDSLHSSTILNCFEREEVRYRDSPERDEPSKEEAIARIYAVIKPGEPITYENAEKDLQSMFFSSRRYDLGRVGRYKLNRRFDYKEPVKAATLTPDDVVNTMKYLIRVYIGEGNVDDIDHLGNRRIRTVGELLTNQLKIAFSRMERIAKERMSLKEADTIKPQDLISIKPVVATIKEFFGSSALSQFMEQVNPLAELTHKRRLNALGPGGLSRDRAGFEVRDVHYSHYGRMCPIETPEGPNIGLIVSLANYTRVNEYGFLETPYRRVVNGKVTKEIEFLAAIDEERHFIAQASAKLDKNGRFLDKQVPVRKAGNYTTRPPEMIEYMDVSPKQVISVSASLIPFLEHDDASRALMGSNMQRQAVPLLRPEAPIVGTGLERRAAYDSGVLVKAKRGGTVSYVSSEFIHIKPDRTGKDEVDVYELIKYQRTNQDTCQNQKPVVRDGQKIKTGDVLADGPATEDGELALGRNVLVAFMSWNGYNYQDAIVISERVVAEDIFTSIHMKEFSIEVRETKLGPEKLTRDIPNTNEKSVEQLDEEGIVRVGAKVNSGSILVGKVTPKSETDSTPEFKLLNSIFGEKAREVRDTSLRLPHGVEGVVTDIQRLKRSQGDELNPGVEEMVKVLVATKRKLQEGDKLAGRHGNKGVVARVFPMEEMPYMEDGTPIDVILSPLGVPSRMNIGQLMETELGWAGAALDERYSTPVFQSATNEMIEQKLEQAGLPRSSKMMLRDGRTGEHFQNPVTVGFMYLMKLHHLVDDKMHARSTGPYSLVTQQPLGGKAQFGGQRLGEMEVWALEAYGAANTLQELLTIKSDDMTGRAKVYESIVKGDVFSNAGIPESFNVLVQELRGLCLDMSIFDARGKQIALTERDEELINRQGSRF